MIPPDRRQLKVLAIAVAASLLGGGGVLLAQAALTPAPKPVGIAMGSTDAGPVPTAASADPAGPSALPKHDEERRFRTLTSARIVAGKTPRAIDAVDQVVERELPILDDHCAHRSDADTDVKLTLSIQPDGRVVGFTAQPTTPAELGVCVQGLARGWSFPAEPSSTPTLVEIVLRLDDDNSP